MSGRGQPRPLWMRVYRRLGEQTRRKGLNKKRAKPHGAVAILLSIVVPSTPIPASWLGLDDRSKSQRCLSACQPPKRPWLAVRYPRTRVPWRRCAWEGTQQTPSVHARLGTSVSLYLRTTVLWYPRTAIPVHALRASSLAKPSTSQDGLIHLFRSNANQTLDLLVSTACSTKEAEVSFWFSFWQPRVSNNSLAQTDCSSFFPPSTIGDTSRLRDHRASRWSRKEGRQSRPHSTARIWSVSRFNGLPRRARISRLAGDIRQEDRRDWPSILRRLSGPTRRSTASNGLLRTPYPNRLHASQAIPLRQLLDVRTRLRPARIGSQNGLITFEITIESHPIVAAGMYVYCCSPCPLAFRRVS